MTLPPPRNLAGLVFLRREALADGYSDRAIQDKVASGEWHRVRRGAYVAGTVWRDLTAADRHRITARAVLKTSHSSTVLSHVSAALEYGVPVWGIDLSEVHVTRTDGKPRRREAGVVHHRGRLAADEVTTIGEIRVTSIVRTAIEMPTITGVESALVSVDALLRLGQPSAEALKMALDRSRHWPQSLISQVVFRLADPRHESAGESRTAFLCWDQRLLRPEPQVLVRDEQGREFARVDFAWPDLGVFLEFDGREKYRIFRRNGESLEDYLMREKHREEQVCMLTGWVCIRISWRDLERPRATGERIRRILASRRQSA